MLSIILGALYCITLIYAVFGWVFIWLGIILLKATSMAEDAAGSGNEAALQECLERMGKFFKVAGIFSIVMIILTIVFMIVYFGVIIQAINSGQLQ